MNDRDLDRALDALTIEPGVGFGADVMSHIEELDAVREEYRTRARRSRLAWLAAIAGGLVAGGVAALALLPLPVWFRQFGEVMIVAIASVDYQRLAPFASLAAAFALAASERTGLRARSREA